MRLYSITLLLCWAVAAQALVRPPFLQPLSTAARAQHPSSSLPRPALRPTRATRARALRAGPFAIPALPPPAAVTVGAVGQLAMNTAVGACTVLRWEDRRRRLAVSSRPNAKTDDDRSIYIFKYDI